MACLRSRVKEERSQSVINSDGVIVGRKESRTLDFGYNIKTLESTSQEDNLLQTNTMCQNNFSVSLQDLNYTEMSRGGNSSNVCEEKDGFFKEEYSFCEQFPEYLSLLREGKYVCGDAGYSMDQKPGWFNENLFRKGQQVAKKYLAGLILAEIVSLFLTFSVSDGLLPLIFTRKSDTPYKAFKRYLSTVIKVKSWYEDDIWNPETEGYKHLKKVRAMHKTVRQRLHSTKPEEIASIVTSIKDSHSACSRIDDERSLLEKVREDFCKSCPEPLQNIYPFFDYNDDNRVFLNQLEMAMTQCSFIGLFVLYPSKFGAHYISEKDLEGLIHVWRCIGYMLGVEDKYNFCNADVKTVKKRTLDVINYWSKPSLRYVSYEWEHMIRCVVKGVSLNMFGDNFGLSLLFLCNILGIYTPLLSASLTLTHTIVYYVTIFCFSVLARFPGVIDVLSWMNVKLISYAQNVPSSTLKSLQQNSCPFGKDFACSHL